MGMAYQLEEGRAYHQEEGKACLQVVAFRLEGKEAFRWEGRGMAAYRDLRLAEGMAYRRVVGACREGNRRAWLLHQHGSRLVAWDSRLLVLRRRMKK